MLFLESKGLSNADSPEKYFIQTENGKVMLLEKKSVSIPQNPIALFRLFSVPFEEVLVDNALHQPVHNNNELQKYFAWEELTHGDQQKH